MEAWADSNLSIKVYPWVDGDTRRAEQKCEEDKDKRNTGRGKEMGRERKETAEEKKRNQFKAREHEVSIKSGRVTDRQRERTIVTNCGKA